MKYSEIHLAAFTERSNRFIARCRLLESGEEDYHSCKKYRAVQRIITFQRSSSGKSSTV